MTMEIIKIAGIGIIGVVISSLLKRKNPEFSLIITVSTGMMLLVLVLSSMTKAITAFDYLVEKTGLDSSLFGGVLKIIGIGYLTEYSANICVDYGSSSVADKIQLGGKITIFIMSLPIVKALVSAVSALI